MLLMLLTCVLIPMFLLPEPRDDSASRRQPGIPMNSTPYDRTTRVALLAEQTNRMPGRLKRS